MLLNILLILIAVVVTIFILRGFDARRMPDLRVWHRARLENEFRVPAHGRDDSFADYLKLEERLFEELDRSVSDRIEESDRLAFNRYLKGSLADPSRPKRNWNRTFELEPEAVRAGVLLIHGLTDAPYSMRAIARVFERNGCYVVGLRVPGHGTAPSSLAAIARRDWRAAVAVAARQVAERVGDRPFYIGGYSNGGALSLAYALDSLDQGSADRRPDRVFLFSPAIGVSEFARLANWHKAFSWLPFFEKARWTSIHPEFDPFKFNSFPKNAGDQVHLLTQENKKRLRALGDSGKLAELPPILTFQSAVDATIQVPDLIQHLYARLSGNHHELVLFDVNRWSNFRRFLKGVPEKMIGNLAASRELPYRYTLVTNKGEDSLEVVARSKPPNSDFEPDRDLGLAWPRQVYSLSHVALTFPPDDPYYGSEEGEIDGEPYRLGALSPRGERDLLRVPVGQLMRLRCNPFWDYMERRLADALRAGTG